MLQLLNVLEAEPGGSRVNMAQNTIIWVGEFPSRVGPRCWSLPFPLFRPLKPDISAKSVSRSFCWALIQCIHDMHSNQSTLESRMLVKKLEPEPIKISASISSSLFSVFCGMSWQGWAAPSWAFGVWISVCQFQELFSKGANVKIGTMSLIHSNLRVIQWFIQTLVRNSSNTCLNAWICVDTGYLIPVIWPSPSLLGAFSSSSSGSATDLLASRQLLWMILMRPAYLGCWGFPSSPSAHLCSQIQIELTWN